MKKRNQIIAAFLAATMIITPATSIFAKAAKMEILVQSLLTGRALQAGGQMNGRISSARIGQLFL